MNHSLCSHGAMRQGAPVHMLSACVCARVVPKVCLQQSKCRLFLASFKTFYLLTSLLCAHTHTHAVTSQLPDSCVCVCYSCRSSTLLLNHSLQNCVCQVVYFPDVSNYRNDTRWWMIPASALPLITRIPPPSPKCAPALGHSGRSSVRVVKSERRPGTPTNRRLQRAARWEGTS